MSNQLSAVLLDIEGTVTPISFVHDVLFPYARAHLEAFCMENAAHPLLAEVTRLVPGNDPLTTLREWMDHDAKIAPLKTIQGMLWAKAYMDGDITAELYPDVAPALRRWNKAGLRLYVYSSGSVEAQKLLFGHTQEGDLTPLFHGFFDTNVGLKRAMASYLGICRGANITTSECLFLSDIEAELDAAAEAGLQTCQLVRTRDKTVASTRHETATDFIATAKTFSLPRAE